MGNLFRVKHAGDAAAVPLSQVLCHGKAPLEGCFCALFIGELVSNCLAISGQMHSNSHSGIKSVEFYAWDKRNWTSFGLTSYPAFHAQSTKTCLPSPLLLLLPVPPSHSAHSFTLSTSNVCVSLHPGSHVLPTSLSFPMFLYTLFCPSVATPGPGLPTHRWLLPLSYMSLIYSHTLPQAAICLFCALFISSSPPLNPQWQSTVSHRLIPPYSHP